MRSRLIVLAIAAGLLSTMFLTSSAQATEIPVTCSFYLGEPYLAGHPTVNWHQKMEGSAQTFVDSSG